MTYSSSILCILSPFHAILYCIFDIFWQPGTQANKRSPVALKKKKNVNLLFHKAFKIVPRLSSVSVKIFTKILTKQKGPKCFLDAPNNPVFFASASWFKIFKKMYFWSILLFPFLFCQGFRVCTYTTCHRSRKGPFNWCTKMVFK